MSDQVVDKMEALSLALYGVLVEGKALPPLKNGWKEAARGTYLKWGHRIPYIRVQRVTEGVTVNVEAVEQNPHPSKDWTFLVKRGHRVVHIFKKTITEAPKSLTDDWRLVVDGKVYDDKSARETFPK